MSVYNTYLPPPALRTWIQYYVSRQLDSEDRFPEVQDILPLNLTAITFFSDPGMHEYAWPGGPFIDTPTIAVIGPMREKRVTHFLSSGRMLTIVFTETGLHKFFSFRMADWTDIAGNGAEMVERNELAHCREAIFNAQTPDAAVAFLNQYFLHRLSKDKKDLSRIADMASLIHARKGNIEVDRLMNHSHMSVKTIERLFKEKIGMGPKYFSRIVRFSHAMRMLDRNTRIYEIINRLGYFDQAHFIREINFFAGSTPRQFQLQDSEDWATKMFLDNLTDW
jgi:AraC-like DNA-binding protein